MVDQRVAENTTGVDVIVGGHTNTLLGDMEGAAGAYPTMVNDVPIVQAYAYGKFLGELNVTFDDDGVVTAASGAPIIMDAAVTEDEATKARIAEAAQPLDEIRNKVVAETAAPIEGDARCLPCDGMLDGQSCGRCDAGPGEGSGHRDRHRQRRRVARLDRRGRGHDGRGSDGAAVPEHAVHVPGDRRDRRRGAGKRRVSQIEEGAGRFPQVAGLTFAVDPSAAAGSRVSDVMVGGAPIDPAKTYGVVSNNYVRNGGDGYSMFVTAQDAYDFGPDLADVTAEYLAQNAPYQPYTDGRITLNP